MREYKTVKNALPLTHFIMFYRDNKLNRTPNRVGKQVTPNRAKKLFGEILKESAAQQNQLIKDNCNLDWLSIRGKDDAATRAQFTYNYVRKLSHASPDRWNRSDLQEASRLLKTWAQRHAIAELLDSSGWTLSYDEVNELPQFTVG